MRVLMAAGPDGSLFVSIPRPGGSVLALLGRNGTPRQGWPITVTDSTECGLLLPVDDGSIRVVCTLENPDGITYTPVGAFAFDADGRLLPGWPVNPGIHGADGYFAGRAIGDSLVLHVWGSRELIEEGELRPSSWIMSVGADGSVGLGAPALDLPGCCSDRAVGPDNVAYGIIHKFADTPAGTTSGLAAVTNAGAPDGFPVAVDGIASGPAFEPDGWPIVVTVASSDRSTSRVLAFGRAFSAALPIVTAEEASTGGCSATSPPSPLVAQDGTIFVYSELDTAVFALDPSLKVMPGWPFRPARPLVRRDERYIKEDAYCPSIAVPAVGPDNILYMPLQARDTTVGGSLAAVGPDGRVRPGWPVELRRSGSEFWSVVVGSDGTVYSLAIEPESGDTSSASILAIAPDSTVLYTTTIIEP